MSLSPKKIVKTFYEADLVHNEEILRDYLHPEASLNWNSSFGYLKKDKEEIIELLKGMQGAYEFSRNKITHIISEKETVSVRYTLFAKAIERSKEDAIAHFICIWELKDNKLYNGYLISQQADISLENMWTFI